jgi:feruloyl-CoA synthase
VSYRAALDAVRRIGAALITRNLSPERPILILSGNSIEHALLGLAANFVGTPYAPVSPAYALLSTDFKKLKYIFDLLTPGLVFVADGSQFRHALEAVTPPDVEIVVTRNPIPKRRVTHFEQLISSAGTSAAEAAHQRVGPDTIAKFLFTSGSTGTPKAVINTQRMWCSNQAMILSQLGYFSDEPPLIMDWAPWNHTAGGNHNFGFVLYNGGTLYIDEGRPVAGEIETTVRNLREVATNWYFTVPKGYEALLPYFRADKELCKTFFSKLKVLWFAGAALSQSVFEEMQELAFAAVSERIMFLTGLGATETAPMALVRTWQSESSLNVGLPVPGVELKLVPLQVGLARLAQSSSEPGQARVPLEDKLEVRLRGPNIAPGYWRQDELTAQAFDEEGFYRLGDALRFENPQRPESGLLFDGRVSEDFKLATGTWVNVGTLRARLLAHLEPYARDVVLAGADRDGIGALIFPNMDACRELVNDAAMDMAADAGVLAEFNSRLNTFARTSTGSSNRVTRAIVLKDPPSLDRGEMTDKGSINQRAVLIRRADMVSELYARVPSARVLVIDRER